MKLQVTSKNFPTGQILLAEPKWRDNRKQIPRVLALAILLLCASFSTLKAQTFSVLHTFSSVSDGVTPYGNVTFDGSGNMYGTCEQDGINNGGTLWEYSSGGNFTVLHSFTSSSDGSHPYCRVTFDSSGNMYGTCPNGGPIGGGTLWKYSSEGNFSVLHNFGSAAGGETPFSGVTIDSSGDLFGTGQVGGANTGGVLWEYSSAGVFSVLHNFASSSDGKYPYAGVKLDASNNIYGTCDSSGPHNGGTLWKYSSGGVFSVLHGFNGSGDGDAPFYGGVTLDVNGNVFGTCYAGGANSGGTLWEYSSGGVFSVLRSFTNASDGYRPYAGVTLDSSGNMYGTCNNGGANSGGTLWEYSSGGVFSVLRSFTPASDGADPYAGVTLDTSGNIYGTCSGGGGTSDCTLWEYGTTATLTGVSVSSNSFMGGSSSVGTVTLSGAAGASGLTITLSSNSQYAVVPPNVTIPAGATSASFPIWTAPSSSTQSAVITATNSTNTFTTNLTLSAYSPYVFNVQVAPTFVVGGSTVTGQVQLDHFVTTIGGEVVDLSSSNVVGSGSAYATVPASVTVPFGANSATFSITTQSVSSVTGVSITATDTGSQSGIIMLLPSGGLGLGLTVSPSGIYGGNSATGTVTLSASQSSSTVVSLASNNSGVTVPTSVTIPAGSTTGTFTVTTSAVGSATSALNGGWVWIACSTGLSSQVVPTSVYPAVLHTITASPNSVAGGSSSTGTVTLSGTAPTGGITVNLSSSSTDAQVPSSITIAAGSNSKTFTITTSNVVASEIVTISATYNSATVSSGFGIGSSVSIHTITSSPSSVTGGASSTGTVTLSNPAPTGGVVVTVSSSNPAAQVPPSVTVPAGSTSETFAITTARVNSVISLSLSATVNGKTVSSGFNIGASVAVRSVTIPTSTVIGGTGSTGTVTLSGAAPTGGTIVTLSSSNSAAQVPTTVTIQAGQTSATFGITTTPVASHTTLSISASLNGHSASYGFIVSAPNFSSLTTTGSTTITGGTTATITATLNGPAPTGGILIALSSSSTEASVPATVLIPAGATSATFSLTTNPVTSTRTITITGTHTQTGHINFKLTP